jgi:hypothetical protein
MPARYVNPCLPWYASPDRMTRHSADAELIAVTGTTGPRVIPDQGEARLAPT